MKAFQLPVRCVFDSNRNPVIAGSAVSHGDAGWSVVSCADRTDALSLMQQYPQARMPCWSRIEP